MNAGRVALVVTCVVVGGLGIWFAAAQWDQANRAATITSALAGVTAVGVAVWTVLRRSQSNSAVRATRTGAATTRDGTANTGVVGKAGLADSKQVQAHKTGDATATGTGDANTGVRLD